MLRSDLAESMKFDHFSWTLVHAEKKCSLGQTEEKWFNSVCVVQLRLTIYSIYIKVPVRKAGSSPVKGESVHVQLLLEQIEGLNWSSSLPSLLAWLVRALRAHRIFSILNGTLDAISSFPSFLTEPLTFN